MKGFLTQADTVHLALSLYPHPNPPADTTIRSTDSEVRQRHFTTAGENMY
jgi:hypothetical protein